MKKRLLLSLAAGLLATVLTSGQAADGKTISLFNGKDLNNWTQNKAGGWEAKDGILGPSAKPGGYIWAKGKYDNFELELDFKMSKRCNSGVFFGLIRVTRCREGLKFRFSIHTAKPRWANMTAAHCTTHCRQTPTRQTSRRMESHEAEREWRLSEGCAKR